MKKQIALMVCVAMALTVVTGCSSNSSNTDAAQESTVAVTQEATTEATEATAAATEVAETEPTAVGEVVSIENNGHEIPGILTMPENVAEGEKVPAVVMLHGTGSNKDEAGVGEVVSIENNGHEIPGILTMPENVAEGEKVPAVVMLHGTGSNKDEAGNGYVLMADAFAKAGIASLRIDFMGTGDSKVDYSEYCNTTAVSDAAAAGDFLAKQEGIDPERIGIMGWSQGGTDALLTAAEHEQFKSVLTWAGAMDLGNLLTDEMYEEAKKNGSAVMEFDWREPLNLGLQWMEEVKSMDMNEVVSRLLTDEMYEEAKKNGSAVMEFDWREPLNLGLQWMEEVKSMDMNEVVSRIKAPILAINGSEDTVVPPENGKTIAELSANDASKHVVIEGGDHTFGIFGEDHTVFNQLMDQTAQWFADTL